jgi:adenylate cyclase
VIHVDSPVTLNCFGSRDLDLLTALANFTAIAVERSRMNEKFALEERRRRRLGRFLSPQVAARVLESTEDEHGLAQALPPELREVTILFADLVGFTTLSERLGPEATAYLLSDYFSQMTEVVFRFDGMLDKFIGDAVMAVFGAPLDMPDHAERAVQAALAMQKRLAAFNADRSAAEKVQMRIAVNTGRVVAAEIGSSSKMEYTVLGDAVNVASRLESGVARPGTVVIGPQTHAMVASRFECRSLGEFRLKGKTEAIEAFAVDGPAASESDSSGGVRTGEQGEAE